ncbi:Nucleotide-binding universal stress protein, UspA family [Desulfacinum hydrothermale DSM 13146]|uniref:Universal stress protein n=1 Tax=Desulfacinum hydrothermale DSM 13146 TaxID=1121390 RepID=A0A1W1WYR1_9BACT|nr:universal stress protein [Desulfacinum hydrothermale]SMC16753.1 Nucleotide-binding universal stress protein, UspA family [Desulfacinum hydrothermale DSM 13146]
MFKKILFPVDLSDVSPQVVPVVREMASRFDAQVHVLFVARVFEHLGSLYVPRPSIRKFESEILEGAEKKLDEFVTEELEGVDVVSRVVSGDPAEEILRYADGSQVDLIIMGTHGRKGLERVIFGSVAERVVKGASIPVLTVNPYKEANSEA